MTLASPLLSGRLILQQHLLLLGLLGQPALSPQHCWSCSLAQSDSFMVLEICTGCQKSVRQKFFFPSQTLIWCALEEIWKQFFAQ